MVLFRYTEKQAINKMIITAARIIVLVCFVLAAVSGAATQNKRSKQKAEDPVVQTVASCKPGSGLRSFDSFGFIGGDGFVSPIRWMVASTNSSLPKIRPPSAR